MTTARRLSDRIEAGGYVFERRPYGWFVGWHGAIVGIELPVAGLRGEGHEEETMSEPIKGVEIVAREMLEETYPKACEILKNWQAALLEAAADRAEQAMRKPYRDADEDVSHVRDAILGRPAKDQQEEAVKDPKDMTTWEFAEWLVGRLAPTMEQTAFVERAIAARETVLLQEIFTRARKAMPERNGLDVTWLRDAILGRPRFVEGQLVRSRDTRVICAFKGNYAMSDLEPIKIEPLPGGYGKVVSDGRRVEVRE